MSFLDVWFNETTCSAIPQQVKEFSSYLTLAQIAQAQRRTMCWENKQGVQFPLGHVKVISLSCIFTGDPGSYKSEAVRFIKKVLRTYNQYVIEHPNPDHTPVPIYPHDSVTKEMLLSTLSNQQHSPDQGVSSSIFIDELINFLNRRDYVEPLLGALNSLMDQPPEYNVGTIKRGDEFIHNPIVGLTAACAPSWFKYLPEAIFTGGFTGRCFFYAVPYPTREERQPMGKVSHEGAPQRMAEFLAKHLPPGPCVLDPDATNLYIKWEMDYGEQRVHPLQSIDEWFKRRAILTARLASCIALSDLTTRVSPHHMWIAHHHMEHVLTTLEAVWEEIDSDDSLRFRVLLTALHPGTPYSDRELLDLTTKRMRNTSKAMQLISYMKGVGILVPKGGKWCLNPDA